MTEPPVTEPLWGCYCSECECRRRLLDEERIDVQRRDMEQMEAERQTARDRVTTALVDARCLLAPDRDMPKEVRMLVRAHVERALRHLEASWRNVP